MLQVVSIVTLGGANMKGGFFPNGLNGAFAPGGIGRRRRLAEVNDQSLQCSS